MTNYFKAFLLLMLLATVSCSGDQKESRNEIVVQKFLEKDTKMIPPPPSVLGAGDELTFNVWRHDNLERTVQIDPAGNIQLPLAGEIKASGLTISQLREEVSLRLSKYLVNPQVDISVSNLKSQNIYVLGEVNSPGSFVLDRRMLAWEAISQAQGFTTDANKEAVLLVRSENGFARIIALNLDINEIFEDGVPLKDFILRNGDLLYVPPSAIADFERFMNRLNNILSPILNIERGIIMSQDVRNVLKGKEISGGVIY